MTAVLVAPAAQALAFVLGCAAIHAAQAHAKMLTRLLTVVAIAAAVLVLLVASVDYGPGPEETFDEVSVYAAS